jgi:beta-glucosidase
MNNYADVDARDSAANPTLFQSAVEGHVLLKNTNNALPFNKPAVLSLFGYDAIGGLNSSSDDELAYPYGLTNTNKYTNGDLFTGLDADLFMAETKDYGSAGPDVALGGTLITGGGSGATTPTSSISPYDAFLQQAAIDGTTLHTDFTSQNPSINATSDACIVFINTQSSESWDRATVYDSYSDTLVENVASKCPNTIVVVHNAGVRLVDGWI